MLIHLVDYWIPLLRLLAELPGGAAERRLVLELFGQQYRDLIPPDSYGLRADGKTVIWTNKVDWARHELVRLGYMDTPRPGTWRITEQSRNWLANHPGDTHLDQVPLASRISRPAPTKVKAKVAPRSARSRPVSFVHAGQSYRLSGKEVISSVRRAISEGLPSEAHDYRTWAVEVDGIRLNLKWVFALVTGASRNTFDSPTARRLLARLGIEAVPVQPDEPAPIQEKQIPIADRDHLFSNMIEYVQFRLSEVKIELPVPKIWPGWHYFQLYYPTYPGSHYEFAAHRNAYEIGLHFESGQAISHRRMRAFLPHAVQLTQAIGRPVQVEPWRDYWARVWCELRLDEVRASDPAAAARHLATFVEATYPILAEAYAQPHPRRTRDPNSLLPADGEVHSVLDHEVSAIRQFLNGRADRPSDEKLCDWIHFCYTFNLFSEAGRLFAVVDPTQVNPWYYERTKRLAKICTLRAQG